MILVLAVRLTRIKKEKLKILQKTPRKIRSMDNYYLEFQNILNQKLFLNLEPHLELAPFI